jgi:hypothetical protein
MLSSADKSVSLWSEACVERKHLLKIEYLYLLTAYQVKAIQIQVLPSKLAFSEGVLWS